MSANILIIDNDAGGDDAMAIFLALLNEKHYNGPKVIALTTVNGNTTESNVNINNQKILKVAKRQDIPIYRGAKDSLLKAIKPVNYYGIDGMGDCDEELEGLVPAQEKHAVLALIELSKAHSGELSVLCLGPLTNIALAIRLDPDFIGRLAHLFIGAGHVHSEEFSTPEFNALVDVEAYQIVIDSANPDNVTVVPFSQVKTHLNFSMNWRENTLGTYNTHVIKAINKYEQVALRKSDRWQTLDPAVIAIAIKQDLVKGYKYSRNSIILHGDQRGIVTNEFVEKEKANVRIAHILQKEDYRKFLMSVFSKE